MLGCITDPHHPHHVKFSDKEYETVIIAAFVFAEYRRLNPGRTDQ